MGLQNVLNIEPGSILWTIITFLIIVWVIAKFGWKPILSGLKAREDSIRSDLDTAKAEREKASAVLAEYQTALTGIKKEAAEIVQRAQESAAQIVEEAREQSREQSRKEIERAKAEIERETEAAKTALRAQVADLTAQAAAKLIGSVVDLKQHEKLIMDALREER
ncbi:MAG TPA: F0F1 ATP synthase subunit B [bacterium]|jgi:F-type H+-transporting ATPase subunit b